MAEKYRLGFCTEGRKESPMLPMPTICQTAANASANATSMGHYINNCLRCFQSIHNVRELHQQVACGILFASTQSKMAALYRRMWCVSINTANRRWLCTLMLLDSRKAGDTRLER
uniref:Uncharacterized protein n=1 Tax=Alectorobius mimon TaxID=360319 RepID=A0A147B9S4_9ACAR